MFDAASVAGRRREEGWRWCVYERGREKKREERDDIPRGF
jgi:hypothetical protein